MINSQHERYVQTVWFRQLPPDARYVYLERVAILEDGRKEVSDENHFMALEELSDWLKEKRKK